MGLTQQRGTKVSLPAGMPGGSSSLHSCSTVMSLDLQRYGGMVHTTAVQQCMASGSWIRMCCSLFKGLSGMHRALLLPGQQAGQELMG